MKPARKYRKCAWWTVVVLALPFVYLSQIVPHVHVVCPHAVSCDTQATHPHHAHDHGHGDDGSSGHDHVLAVHIESHCPSVPARSFSVDADSEAGLGRVAGSVECMPSFRLDPDRPEVLLKAPPAAKADPRAPPLRDQAVL